MQEPTDDDRENYRTELEYLWDVLSDTIEGGRLTEDMIPDDYAALVRCMTECEKARVKAADSF